MCNEGEYIDLYSREAYKQQYRQLGRGLLCSYSPIRYEEVFARRWNKLTIWYTKQITPCQFNSAVSYRTYNKRLADKILCLYEYILPANEKVLDVQRADDKTALLVTTRPVTEDEYLEGVSHDVTHFIRRYVISWG